MAKAQVGIVIGSISDREYIMETCKILDFFDIQYELTICSAHRTPAKAAEYAKNAAKNGLEIIIAGAGAAAHLGGVLASHTLLPVIGVPIPSSELKGVDALYSTVQMPGGIPVATMAIGKSGAKNAGILAAEILALKNPSITKKLKEYRKELADKVEKDNKKLKNS
ncbi:MAG: 5-(carboxyamino)imidazole ribonucleotide mutase [bacterium]|nr:5-(carboxyamino)imidazole ribonucleotide mutase [bacterium]